MARVRVRANVGRCRLERFRGSRGDGGREKGVEGERLRWGLEVWIWRDEGRALRLLGRVEAVGRRTRALRAGVVSVCGGNA